MSVTAPNALLIYSVITLFHKFIGLCDTADTDECLTNNGGCSADASCSNAVGSFTCTCKSGYTGDGFACSGKSSNVGLTLVLIQNNNYCKQIARQLRPQHVDGVNSKLVALKSRVI